jgi:hypothetical protein
MPPQDYPVLTDYAVSDEGAAYIADALMELALEFEATRLAPNPPTPQSPQARI